jgi:hypothetical protein
VGVLSVSGCSFVYKAGKKSVQLLVAEKRVKLKSFFGNGYRRGKKGIHLLAAEKRAVLTCGGQKGRGFTC